MAKITKREKILIIILTIVMSFAGYYQFIFKNQLRKINELHQTKVNNDISINKQISDELSIKKLQLDIDNENKKIKTTMGTFFPSLIQENIILILDEAITDSNINAESISFSKISTENIYKDENMQKGQISDKSYIQNIIDEYKALMSGNRKIDSETKANAETGTNIENKDNSTAKDNTQPNVQKITVNIKYSGIYEELVEFINIIKSYKNKIVISNIIITSNVDNTENIVTDINNINTNEVSGDMTLEFYVVPRIFEENNGEEWEYSREYGKENPFKKE